MVSSPLFLPLGCGEIRAGGGAVGSSVSEEEGKDCSCSASSEAAPTSSSLASKGISTAPGMPWKAGQN
jgi:hypothetical protein